MLSVLKPIQAFVEDYTKNPRTFCNAPDKALLGDSIYHRCLAAVAISTLLTHTLPDLEATTRSDIPTLSTDALSVWTKYLYDSHIRVWLSDDLSLIMSIPRLFGLGDIQRGKDLLRFIETNGVLMSLLNSGSFQVPNPRIMRRN